MYLNRILLISLLLLTTLTGWNQNVISAGNDTTICPNNSVTLTGTIGSYSPNPPTQVLFGPSPGYTTYDDGFSTNWAPIGFTFTYYGNNYTQLLISSNAYLSFTGAPGGYSPWSIASPIPNAANPLNAIMAPWQDTYPGLSGVGSVRYKTVGNAPNRIFIVEYLDIPMFSCGTTFCYGAQIKLFEGTNVIETHIANKPLCSSWNMGRAIHGTHNAAGNIGHPVPGRNSPTQWSTTMDGKRFTPNGNNAYTITNIPFSPTYMPNTINPATIQWLVNGSVIATGQTITVTPPQTTTYVVRLNYSSCNQVSFFTDTVTVTVGNFPVQASNDTTICLGASIPLTVNGNFQNPQFSWAPAGSLSNASVQSPLATPSQTTTYTVTVTEGTCTGSDQVTVTVAPLPVTAMNDTSICFGNSTPLSVLNTGQYNNPTFQWSPANTLNNPTAPSPIANPTTQTTYTVTVTDGPCSNSDVVTVNIFALPVVTVTPAAPFICPGSAVQLTAYGATNYAWSPNQNLTSSVGNTTTANPLTQTTYTVTGVDNNGCINDTTVTVSIYVPATAGISPPLSEICFGDTLQLTGTGSQSYQWSGTGYLSSNSGLNIQVAPTQTNTYTVIGTDANGCTDTAEATVQVNPLPIVQIGSDIVAGCSPIVINFTDGSYTSANNSMVNWLWTFEGNGNSYSANPSLGFSTPGQYDVSLTVTSDKGCIDSLTMPNYIEVYSLPIAGFVMNPETTTTASPDILFTNNSSQNVTIWDWNFAGMGSSSHPSPTFPFMEAGEYPVIQIVSTENGCLDTAYGKVVVENISEIFIPNTFTPNNDGLNDFFFPVMSSYDNNYVEVHIFDRWGSRIYLGTDVNKPWDGKYNDSMCPNGVYAYRIIFKNEQGDEYKYVGNLNLIR